MKSVTIPWGCWRGNKSLPLTFPQNWKVSVAAMADRGMRLYWKVNERKAAAEIFRGRKVIVLSPNCSRADLLERYPESTILCNTWEAVCEELKDGGSGQSVTIFPNGSLQFTPLI